MPGGGTTTKGVNAGIDIPLTIDKSGNLRKFLEMISELEKKISGMGASWNNVFGNQQSANNMRVTNLQLQNVTQNTLRDDKIRNRFASTLRSENDAWGIYSQRLGDANFNQRLVYESTEQLSESIIRNLKPLQRLQMGFGSLIRRIESFLPIGLGFHFSVTNIVSDAHHANKEMLDWYKSMAQLSNASGDASQSIGTWIRVFGKSAGSLGTVQQVLIGLNAQGIRPATAGFENLAHFVTNLSLATGISSETFSQFAGVMVRNWQMSTSATIEMTSSVLAMQEAFGNTTGEIEATIKVVSDSMEKMAAFFNDGEESARALTKGIAQTVGVLTKLGVSTQKATEFMNKLLDPEQMGENIALMNRLGISYQDYMDMMASSNAKQTMFDRLMTNLPQVAQQIQSIANPMARMNFAKSLGLPLEIAQKMANATAGDIRKLMEDYQKAAIRDEAAKKKQEQMKAESQKFDETLHLLKRDALQPMMQWIYENMGLFWEITKKVFASFKKYTAGLTKVFDAIKSAFLPAFDVLGAGGSLGDFLMKLEDGLIQIMGKAIGKVFDIIATTGPQIARAIYDAWSRLLERHPIITSLVTAAIGFRMFSRVAGMFHDFKNAFFARGSSPMRPMFVRDISNGIIAGRRGGGLMDMLINTPLGRTRLGRLTTAMRGTQSSVAQIAGQGLMRTQMARLAGSEGVLGRLGAIGRVGGTLFARAGTAGGAEIVAAGLKTAGPRFLMSMGSTLAKALGPIGLTVGAIMGAVNSFQDAGKLFNKTGDKALTTEQMRREALLKEKEARSELTDMERRELEMYTSMRQHGQALNQQQHQRMAELTRLQQNGEASWEQLQELARLQLQAERGPEATMGQKVAAGLAGGLSLGILPLIDKVFNTQFTGKLAGIFYRLGETFTSLNETEIKREAELRKKINDGHQLTIEEQEEYNRLYDRSNKTIAQRIGQFFWETSVLGFFARQFMNTRLTGVEQVQRERLQKLTRENPNNLRAQAQLGELEYKATTSPIERWWNESGSDFVKDLASNIATGAAGGTVAPGLGISGAVYGTLYTLVDKILPAPEFQERMAANRAMSDSERRELELMETRLRRGEQLNREEMERFRELRQVRLYHVQDGITQEERQLQEGLKRRIQILRKSGKKEDKDLADRLEKQLNQRRTGMREEERLGSKSMGWLAYILSAMFSPNKAERIFGKIKYWWEDSLNEMSDALNQFGLFIKELLRPLGQIFDKLKLSWLKMKIEFQRGFSFNIFGRTWTIGGSDAAAINATQEQITSLESIIQTNAGAEQRIRRIREMDVDRDIFKEGVVEQTEAAIHAKFNAIAAQINELAGNSPAAREEAQSRIEILKRFRDNQLALIRSNRRAEEIEKQRLRDAEFDRAIQLGHSRTLGGIAGYTRATAEALNRQEHSRLGREEWINAYIGVRSALMIGAG